MSRSRIKRDRRPEARRALQQETYSGDHHHPHVVPHQLERKLSNRDPLLVVILGPTGSGKTSLSLELAERFHGEIVNCDSVAIYREFRIATAKPTREELARAPHHLFDEIDPMHYTTSGEYARRAREVLAEVRRRGTLPIVVGGTGLYLRALLEGLFLGGVSAMLELRFPGIAIQAVALTFGTCICLLLAYRSGLIRATEKFKLGIIAATGGIALIYFLSIVLGLFHVQIPYIFGSSPIGILFSVVVVVIAALNLILDFDFIEQGALSGAPKYMEWYAAFGLMVTLIWLYLEIIRLLSKLRDRR